MLESVQLVGQTFAYFMWAASHKSLCYRWAPGGPILSAHPEPELPVLGREARTLDHRRLRGKLLTHMYQGTTDKTNMLQIR